LLVHPNEFNGSKLTRGSIIDTYLFTPEKHSIGHTKSDETLRRVSKRLNILRTCTQIYSEAAVLAFSLTPFTTSHWVAPRFQAALSVLPFHLSTTIRILEICPSIHSKDFYTLNYNLHEPQYIGFWALGGKLDGLEELRISYSTLKWNEVGGIGQGLTFEPLRVINNTALIAVVAAGQCAKLKKVVVYGWDLWRLTSRNLNNPPAPPNGTAMGAPNLPISTTINYDSFRSAIAARMPVIAGSYGWPILGSSNDSNRDCVILIGDREGDTNDRRMKPKKPGTYTLYPSLQSGANSLKTNSTIRASSVVRKVVCQFFNRQGLHSSETGDNDEQHGNTGSTGENSDDEDDENLEDEQGHDENNDAENDDGETIQLDSATNIPPS
jgi:hypothetical protein